MNRNALLQQAADEKNPWDVLVIGGGATGLGTALDAVARGYRTVLVERSDFAQATSSRSTKLIHGGVRYLRQGQIGMVRQSLQERRRLLKNAPHLVNSLEFVLPAYQRGARWYYYAGLKAYDLLSASDSFPPAQLLSRSQVIERLPTLHSQHLQGGGRYSDGQFDDARLAITLARTIVDHGGITLNYAQVERLIHERGRVAGAEVTDLETQQRFTVRAHVVINATGVFAEQLMGLDAAVMPPDERFDSGIMIRPSQGSHLVFDGDFLKSSSAMMIPETDDGRVLFAIPWHGQTLFGTTDLPVRNVSANPRPLQEEVDYLLQHAARYFTRTPRQEDIQSMFAGLRPLVASSGKKSTAGLSREHEIVVSGSGMISIIGGKWTTYRRMGQDVIDLAQRTGDLPSGRKRSNTASLKLHAAPVDLAVLPETDHGINSPDPLVIYGTDAAFIRKLQSDQPELNQRLHPQFSHTAAEVIWCVRHEMARTVEDILARRTRMLFLNAQAAMEAADAVATLMQTELNQPATWKAEQIAAFQQTARTFSIGSS